MEQQYSVEFFNSLIHQIQEVCRNYLNYSQFVEVSGYVSVEIDNMKKERYVLSELLQSSGNVVSESYCTKAFKTAPSVQSHRTAPVSVSKENRNYGRGNPGFSPPAQYPQSRPKRRYNDISHDDRSYGDNMEHAPKQATWGTDNSGEINQSSSSFRRVHGASMSRSYTGVKGKQIDDRTETNFSPPQPESRMQTLERKSDAEEQEEVIDLDLFDDDDIEISGSTEYEGQICDSGAALIGAGSLVRKTQLSPGSLVAVNNTVKRLKKFVSHRYGTEVDLLATSPENLNEMLLLYFKESRKKDGSEFAPVSMKNVMAFLERYLSANGYSYSVTKGHQFQSARDYIKVRMDETVKNTTNVLSPLTREDIELLFQMNLLGDQNPDTLANTMWFLNSMYFNIRRPAEHFNLKWGDIVLKVDDEGREYLIRPINENFGLKLFPNLSNPSRCFVNFYKQFKAHRPKMHLDHNAPFYLKPNKFPGDGDYWLSEEPVTWSMLSALWRKIVIAAGLPPNKRIVGENGQCFQL